MLKRLVEQAAGVTLRMEDRCICWRWLLRCYSFEMKTIFEVIYRDHDLLNQTKSNIVMFPGTKRVILYCRSALVEWYRYLKASYGYSDRKKIRSSILKLATARNTKNSEWSISGTNLSSGGNYTLPAFMGLVSYLSCLEIYKISLYWHHHKGHITY